MLMFTLQYCSSSSLKNISLFYCVLASIRKSDFGPVVRTLHCNPVSVLGQDEGYTVKYNPLPEGVPEGKARGNCQRQKVIFDILNHLTMDY